MRLSEIISEMPIETFNTIGNFERNSSYRQPADRRLVTNPKTVERAKTMWANTQFDFRMWFVNNPEANRVFNEGPVTPQWMAQNMPKTWAEMQQQGGIGPDAINMVYANNKGGNWRPMTGWMMAHRMAHAVLQNKDINGQRPIDYIQREFLQHMESILHSYETELPRQRSFELMLRNPMLRHIVTQMGTMKSARTRNLDSTFEFIFECFAQWLLTGKITFNPMPQNMIVGYSGGRPMRRSAYSDVDLDQANDYSEYIADELGQEFDRVCNGVIGKIVVI